MNFLNALAVTLLLASPFTATAADYGVARAGSSIGHWIAAQGNAALREIADDLGQELKRSLQPLRPTPEPAVLHAEAEPDATAETAE